MDDLRALLCGLRRALRLLRWAWHYAMPTRARTGLYIQERDGRLMLVERSSWRRRVLMDIGKKD